MSPSSRNVPWWSPRLDSKPARVVGNTQKRVVGILAFTAFIGLLLGAAFATPQEQPRRISVGIIESPATLDALVATCTGLIRWDSPMDLIKRLPWNESLGPAQSQADAAVKTPSRVRLGFYTESDPDLPSPASLAYFISQGGSVAWYVPGGEQAPLDGLKSLVSIVNDDGGRFVAVPWPRDQIGKMPVFSRNEAGKRILYMRWGLAQSCAVASDAVMKQIESTPLTLA